MSCWMLDEAPHAVATRVGRRRDLRGEPPRLGCRAAESSDRAARAGAVLQCTWGAV